ncbi:MAG: hypothetical protein IT430_00265 [Phycisphaerales bacterium]|nr:hypothetical protein [Phycisphaerales bacterium]
MSNRMMIAALLASLAALLVSARLGLAQPVLSLEGGCPGFLRAEVRNAPPGSGILLLFAPHEGSFTLPRGNWCYGVTLGLGWRGLRQVAGAGVDEHGFAFFEGQAGQQACGGFLQTLNYPSGGCEISNVVQIPN